MLAFILPGEESLFPDIGPSLSPAVFGRAFLEGETLAGRVGLRRFGMAEEFTEIEKMLLRGGAFGELHLFAIS